MIQLNINNKYDFKVNRSKEGFLINDNIAKADIQQLNEVVYHILNDNRSYNAEVINFNREEKTAEIKVNGTIYSIKAKDQFDILLDKLGLSSLASVKISDLKAPMPGLVLKIFIEEGMTVLKGENLFILEAMKMENIIKSPADVTIKTSKIKPGDKVEKGQVLLQFH